MGEKRGQAADENEQQKDLGRAADHLLSAPIEEKYQARRDREQQSRSQIIDRHPPALFHMAPLLEISQRKQSAGETDRRQQEKTPAPAEIVDHQAADARTQNKAHVVRRRHRTLCSSGEFLRHRFRGQCPTRRLQHCAADTLNEASQNQLQQRLR